MFDSSLCDRPFSNSLFTLPLLTSWSHIGWRKQLLLVILVTLAILGIRWLIQHKRAKRWLRNPKAILLLFGIAISVPIFFAVAPKGLVAFLASDSNATAETIVVLGRGRQFERERLDVTAELWQAKRAPRIFISGKGDALSLISQLEAKGIPSGVLDGENCSRTTAENAIFTAAILKARGMRRIILVTDEPHMLRSLLVFRAFGFAIVPHTAAVPSSLGFKGETFLAFREYMGIIGYGFQGLFLPQHSAESPDPALVDLVQKAEQYGKQQRLQSEELQDLRLN